MYEYMYANKCMHIYVCIYVYISMHLSIHICVHICMHICMHICKHISKYISYMYANMYAFIFAYMCAYVYVYMYPFVSPYMSAYIYANMQVCMHECKTINKHFFIKTFIFCCQIKSLSKLFYWAIIKTSGISASGQSFIKLFFAQKCDISYDKIVGSPLLDRIFNLAQY